MTVENDTIDADLVERVITFYATVLGSLNKIVSNGNWSAEYKLQAIELLLDAAAEAVADFNEEDLTEE